MTNKKQAKITKLFQRATRLPEEDCDDLQEEVLKLEQTLKEKQDFFFQLQRNKLRCTRALPKKKFELFLKPQKLMLTNSVDSLKREIDLMSMLSGVEVQSYVADEHCSIMYHMQHHSNCEVKHGLMITMNNGEYEVSKSSLPLGFNLPAVLESFDKIMQPECLLAVRRALVAYYDRLEQYDRLMKFLKIEAQLFKILDGSHIEIKFTAQNENKEEPEAFEVTLRLEYRVYDIRPKQYSFIEIDVDEGAVDTLRHQCSVFKKKPLQQAFKEAFIDGNGPFIMVSQFGILPVVERKRRKPKHFRPPNPHYNNDDTFHPEDCPETDDDAEE